MRTQADRSMLEGKSIVIFRAAIKSKWTRDPYERRLAAFLRYHFMTCDDFVNTARHDLLKAEQMVIEFILKEKKRAISKEISSTTMVNSLKPLKLLQCCIGVVTPMRPLYAITGAQTRRHAKEEAAEKE